MDRVKYTMEFLFRASPNILYNFITTPACLVRWFCDEVDITPGGKYTFFWSGSDEVAEVIEDEPGEFIRFQWEDADDDDEYLEFKMDKSPVTGETILLITDFADEDDLDDQKQLWETQIQKLRVETGG
ncbi:MAG: SRPBCC domain-containing protein [Bacteroidetes bacterium]|nr:MAG: SRPBCC domain-containing protein [Bacteroidota bacterium]